MTHLENEKINWWNVLFFPLFFIALLWVVKYAEFVFDVSFAEFGIYPREWKGIVGVFTAPLVHGDVKHLFSNSIPLLVLGAGVFYFYRVVAFRVITFIYLATGFWVWISARPSFHIGASGVVYGLATFIFLSGVLRKNKYLMAFSLFVVFVYGSLIWGVLPLEVGISWESHLMGAIAGIIAAVHYRKIGIQKETFDWEREDYVDDENEIVTDFEIVEIPENKAEEDNSVKIVYHFKDKKDSGN
ncbi:MAG: rhomboid family intramembrane serine protease [Bacteroidota bacterium]